MPKKVLRKSPPSVDAAIAIDAGTELLPAMTPRYREPDLTDLDARTERYAAGAIPDTTKKSYAGDIRHYVLSFGGPLPPTPESLREYLTAYAGVLKVDTLRRRMAGISHYCLARGFEDPTRDIDVKQVLRGIRRAHNTLPASAKPLVLDELLRVDDVMRKALPATSGAAAQTETNLRLARDRAMLLIGFWCGMRAEELTRLTIKGVQVRHAGQRKELHIELPHTKNHPEGQRWTLTAQSRHCPVAAVEDWKDVAGFIDPQDEGALFRGVNRSGEISDEAMHVNSVTKLLRVRLKAAGFDYERYSPQSLRGGFATSASEHGISPVDASKWVGWNSPDVAARYVSPTRTAAAQLLAKANTDIEPKVRVAPTLHADQWRQLEELGHGDAGAGIRFLLDCWYQESLGLLHDNIKPR